MSVTDSFSSTSEPQPRVVGIVGSGGAYGRWLRLFFTERLNLEVIGHDPADPESVTEEELLDRSDVLIFSAPIRITPEVIHEYAQGSRRRERGRLWIDVTSVKVAPVAAMLTSEAEVVGLHPMTAPPKAPTLKGRVMVVCEARLDRWRDWVGRLLRETQAECVWTTPEHHDRVMALVQGMVHATHLVQGRVLCDWLPPSASNVLEQLLPYRSVSFEMNATMMARILSLNPAIYEDIQFENPHVVSVLERLNEEISQLLNWVRQATDDDREAFRRHFFSQTRDAMGPAALAHGNYNFERLGYLLADLTEHRFISVHLPEDRPGSLRVLLHIFERHAINLTSIHSSRTPSGEVHFRIGFQEAVSIERLRDVAAEIEHTQTGRVLSLP